MHIGVFYFPTDYGIDIRELARAVEERGLESFREEVVAIAPLMDGDGEPVVLLAFLEQLS